MSVEEQLQILSRGTVDILPEDGLKQKLEKSIAESCPLRVKLGVDPTAPDIHLGHTVVLRKLRAFQDLGHQAVLIIGDYTALIGDPSGKSKTRPQLTEEDVKANAETYLQQVERLLDTDKLEIVHNGDFFRDMTFADVLKLTSRMTVSQMLARDDFSKRYKEQNPISLHEFLYPLMQGWDSVQVRADVELGGTDQTFNLLVGRELQKEEGMVSQVCVTLPLLVGLDGTNKMSKSLGNYIGVDEDPNEMYGKAMSIPDELMKDYFTLLTNAEDSEIDTLLSGHPRDAKDRLARDIVTQYHGPGAAEAAASRFSEIFAKKQLPDDMPTLNLSSDDLEDGNIWIVKLVTSSGFASSNGEARRLVQQGGVSVDGETINDPAAQVSPVEGAVLKVGKRRFAKISLS
jgi:tyrosyl-tRNA synthetase